MISALEEDLKDKPTKWEKIELTKLAVYNCTDCDATFQLFNIFRKELNKRNTLQMEAIMVEAGLTVIDLETNGVLIDKEFVKETIPKIDELLVGYRKELNALVGRDIDWNSNAVVARYLYDELKIPSPYGPGTRPVDDDALDRLSTPITNVLRKYRKAFKLGGTYFKGYFSKTDLDGRLRGRFWLVETASCRLSASDPNLQNLPKSMSKDNPGYEDLAKFKVKNAIVAPEGWTLVAADQSQAEINWSFVLVIVQSINCLMLGTPKAS